MKYCCECKNFQCLINQGVSWCSKNNPVFFLDGEEVVCEDRESTGDYTTTTSSSETLTVDYSDHYAATDEDIKSENMEYHDPLYKKGWEFYVCPHCGESYYRIDYQTSTAMYCPPVYKDGKLISHDCNTTIDHCSCLACGHHFEVKNGKQEKVEKND